jgi:hypothetical protein
MWVPIVMLAALVSSFGPAALASWGILKILLLMLQSGAETRPRPSRGEEETTPNNALPTVQGTSQKVGDFTAKHA